MIHYSLLGHSNATIGIIIESLYQIYGSDVEITVINNIPLSEIENRHLPYQIDKIKVMELMHDKWIMDNRTKILLGTYGTYCKKQIYRFFKNHYQINSDKYSNIIHPQTSIASTCQLKTGINISPEVCLAPYVELNAFININRNVSIGHNTIIGRFSNIAPGVNIAGLCKIGECVTIGIGATIVDNIEIGDNTVIGAGSVVTKSLPANCLAYGVPAIIIRQNQASECLS